MAYIHVYKDGVQLSEGTGLTPLSLTLNATNNEESAAQALVAKTETGYTTSGNTTIEFTGATADKWSVCDTADGTYGPTLEIATPITEDGTTFYVKAKATDGETPKNDDTVDIKLSCVIAAV